MKKLLLFSALCLFFLSIANAAMALGIGAYVDLNVGGVSAGQSGGPSIYANGGLILDTSAAKNEIFNYRLRVGGGTTIGSGASYAHISVVQAFCVSPTILRGEGAKFFFGPRIGLHYIGGSYTAAQNPMMRLIPIAALTAKPAKVDLNAFKADLGLILLGFNFNFSSNATLSFEFGGDYGVLISSGGQGSSSFSSGPEGFANISVMYRINDNYTANN